MSEKRLKDLDDWCGDLCKPGIEQARCMVHDTPTVAAEPVRHARWIKKSAWRECSACNAVQPTDDWDDYIDYPWCPNCGARMDAEQFVDTNKTSDAKEDAE